MKSIKSDVLMRVPAEMVKDVTASGIVGRINEVLAVPEFDAFTRERITSIARGFINSKLFEAAVTGCLEENARRETEIGVEQVEELIRERVRERIDALWKEKVDFVVQKRLDDAVAEVLAKMRGE